MTGKKLERSAAEVARNRAIAEDILADRDSRRPGKARDIADLAVAYEVQAHLVNLLAEREMTNPAGYKLGLTSAAMQAAKGIDHPVSGIMWGNHLYPSGVELARHRYGQLGLEFEIAMRMGQDLPAEAGPFGVAAVADAVAAVCPAVEVVDGRGGDLVASSLPDLVADNIWHCSAVLSPWVQKWPDLADATGVLYRDGEEIARAKGVDIMGHPMNAMCWLANHLRERGRGLKAGEVVITGSFTKIQFPPGPCRYRFEVAGLGAVEVAVA